MRFKQYAAHAALYFVKLLILVTLIFALLFATGNSSVSARYYFSLDFLTSARGLMLIGAMLLIAAAYPSFGVVRRKAGARITEDRDKIINAFISNGYSLKNEVPGRMMEFRIGSPVRKLVMMFDDKVTVTADGQDGIIVEGLRKGVVQALWRIESYMRNSGNNE